MSQDPVVDSGTIVVPHHLRCLRPSGPVSALLAADLRGDSLADLIYAETDNPSRLSVMLNRSVSQLPFGLGLSCLPMPLRPLDSSQPSRIANNLWSTEIQLPASGAARGDILAVVKLGRPVCD